MCYQQKSVIPFLPINYFWPKPLTTMQIDRPPDRLGRPPNCRWITRRPPDPPPRRGFGYESFSNFSNEFRMNDRSQSSRSVVTNRIQMKMPVPSCQRFGEMKHIYNPGGTCATSKKQQSHFLPINYFWPKPLTTMRIDRPPDRHGRPPNCRWITLKFPDSISFFTNEIGSENQLNIYHKHLTL